MNHQQGFVVGVSWSRALIKWACDHFLLSITANLWCSLSPFARRGVPTSCCCSGFAWIAQGCPALSWSPKPEPKPEGHFLWLFEDTAPTETPSSQSLEWCVSGSRWISSSVNQSFVLNLCWLRQMAASICLWLKILIHSGKGMGIWDSGARIGWIN